MLWATNLTLIPRRSCRLSTGIGPAVVHVTAFANDGRASGQSSDLIFTQEDRTGTTLPVRLLTRTELLTVSVMPRET
jgi:hypothetical protein